MSQFERELIRERTMEGLASARARGRMGGRPGKDKKTIDQALTLYTPRRIPLMRFQRLRASAVLHCISMLTSAGRRISNTILLLMKTKTLKIILAEVAVVSLALAIYCLVVSRDCREMLIFS